jgi:NAD(P)-dependent dehydrogenase (short-subunit alcohol dehydrogenase family)
MMERRLDGKLALITGSSRGVGQQIAMGLAQLGANVIVHGRTRNNTESTLSLIAGIDVETYAVEGDLMKNEDIAKITSYLIDKFGGVDILYNNAAIMSPFKENMWEHSSDAWETSFQVNVYALYYFCSAFIPGMIKRGYGRVINLTSGIKDQPELLPYSATKAAVDKLTQDIAVKLDGTGVRINRLDPGWLKTDMGGPEAWNEVTDVLPGALVPALISNGGPNGEFFSAIELKDTKI